MNDSARPRPNAGEPASDDLLGPLGLAVMRIIWDRGEATVSAVADALNAERTRRLAHNTVATIMARLGERGLLVREGRGRRYSYRPVGSERDLPDLLGARAVDDLLARYGNAAIRQFAERLAEVDPELRTRIVELAARREDRAR